MINNENSLHSGKIDSQYFYNSQESKMSRHSRNSSKERDSHKSPFESNNIQKKEQRGGYAHNYSNSQDFNKVRIDKINLENSFCEIENRIKRAPKNFVPPQNIPKQSIRAVKGNLYEALNNINKELNVKIEKREIPKLRVSLLDYLYSNNQEDPSEIRKNSKKVDIDDVMENISNMAKENDQVDLNLTPLNISKKELNEDTNIEGILNNSNLNKSNSFNTITMDKFRGNVNTIDANSNNLYENNFGENQNLFFTGIRLANEVDNNKMMNQMHSNYSSIHGKHNSIPYHKKKKYLKNSFNDDENRNSIKNLNGSTSQGDVNNNLLAEEDKFKLGMDEVNTNKNFESLNSKNNESAYRKNKVSPNTIVKATPENNLELEKAFLNFESNFESVPHMNLNSNYNTQNFENLIQFNSNYLIDLKEKEIFDNLVKNEIMVKKLIRKNNNSKNLNSYENFYQFDFNMFLKYMKTRELDFSNKENELNNLKIEISYLKKDAENKNNLMRSLEVKQESTDSELKLKIKELETQLKSIYTINSKLEKENGIIKNELVNSKKSKNFILKKFNEEMMDMNKLSKEFFDNFVSMEN